MAYEMTQLILQPTGETNDTSTTLDIICMVSPLGLHTSNEEAKYDFNDHYPMYTEFAFDKIDARKPTYNTVKFRDMKPFNPDIL